MQEKQIKRIYSFVFHNNEVSKRKFYSKIHIFIKIRQE